MGIEYEDSQDRITYDEYLSFSEVKLRGVDRKLYAYMSNRGLSRKRFEFYYRRWLVEVEIRRKAGAIVRWVMGVWHKVSHMPEVYGRLLWVLEVIEWIVSVLWRYAPFLDDDMVLFWLSRFIKEDSYRAKL